MHDFPEEYQPLNFCRLCGVDFTSLRAFDTHLEGTPQKRSHRFRLDAGFELRDTVLGVDRYGLVVTDAEKDRLKSLKDAA